MTWILRGITFPIDPSSVKKKTTRIQKPVAIIGDFPSPSLNQPTKFELVFSGFIWPRNKAQALDEATKNAESEDIMLSVTDDDTGSGTPWFSGMYAVSKSEVKRDKPLYFKEGGVDVEVYKYNITLAKFADAGGEQPSEEGGPGEDETGTGFLDMPDEVGFDSNGDGDIDPEEIFNWLTNILTFGVFK